MSTTSSKQGSFEFDVSSLLDECKIAMSDAISAKSSGMLVRDLTAAVSALELINRELREGNGRPIGRRSSQFMRYVIDEGEQMALNTGLRDRIVSIEERYAKLLRAELWSHF